MGIINKVAHAVVGLIFVGTACADKNEASEKTFAPVVGAYLAKKPLCLTGFASWPIDLERSDSEPLVQLQALEKAGLVSDKQEKVRSEVEKLDLVVRRFTLTERGSKFIGPAGGGGERGMCYGRKALDKVVKWDVPAALGGPTQTRVFFTYRVDGLADWAKMPEVKRAFPSLARNLDGGGSPSEVTLHLTSAGWEGPEGPDLLEGYTKDLELSVPPQQRLHRLP
jgi:hypothetical protein